jgi:cytochrome c
MLIRTGVLLGALAVLVTVKSTLASDDAVDADEALLASLPEGPGKEESFYLCHTCHSFRLVSQQRLSRAHWDETLDWMVEEQGMPELDDEERALILDYLGTHYGEDSPR